MNLSTVVLNALGYRPLTDVTYVIVHHSVGDQGLDIEEVALEEQKSQGFVTVGYHAYAKCANKLNDVWVVQQGRPINAIPAAAYGLNLQSYDICIAGNYQPGIDVPLNRVSEHALHVVAGQILDAKKRLPNVRWLIGHRDVAKLKAKEGLDPSEYSTACPGDDLYNSLDALRMLVGLGKPVGL